MWITDTCYRDEVEIWELARDGASRHRTAAYTPSFYLHLPDPAAHWELLEALESAYGAEECTFRTVHGDCEGYHVPAGREVALRIERQTGFTAGLYNVDLRPDHRYLAGRASSPAAGRRSPGSHRISPRSRSGPSRCISGASLFRRNLSAPLTWYTNAVNISTGRNMRCLPTLPTLLRPSTPMSCCSPTLTSGCHAFSSPQNKGGSCSPSAGVAGTGSCQRNRYWSYGKTEYRAGSLIPDGRILIDTAQSFHYRESGLAGIILGARLTGLAPNLTARFTSGTLISAYEVYEALRRGIAVPFRKSDPEAVRRFCDLKATDRGGMMFQPVPGLYDRVSEIDFTSLYPSIIVSYNLSPETLVHPDRKGFLPLVLEPLLALRKESKARKMTDPSYAGIDAILKWMLVTCFGYTGYKNAKFGQIEVHEKITGHARDILLTTKECAEEMGFDVLHGIVDCLWVKGGSPGALKVRVEEKTGLHTTLDSYDWIVFLPMPDGFGAYNRYYGCLSAGEMKVRGIMARTRRYPSLHPGDAGIDAFCNETGRDACRGWWHLKMRSGGYTGRRTTDSLMPLPHPWPSAGR